MLVDEYQAQAVASDQSKGHDTARYLLLGVFGEAGGLLTAVKKRERDAETLSKYLAQVTEEVGDLLWYLAAVAHRNGVMLSTLTKTWSPQATVRVKGSVDERFTRNTAKTTLCMKKGVIMG